MGELLGRLDTFLGYQHSNLYGNTPFVNKDMYDEVFERMFDFVTSLEPEQLTEEQAEVLYGIIEDIDLKFDDGTGEEDEDEEDVDEAARPKMVRINRAARRKRKMAYKKNRAKLRMKAKRYRKSARGKRLAKKAKIMARRGKTATGKRIRRFR